MVISRRQRLSTLLLAGSAVVRTALTILALLAGIGPSLASLVICLVWDVYCVTPIWLVLSRRLLSLEKQHAAVDRE